MKKLILICLLATLFVGCTSSTEPEQQATDPTDSAPTVAESPTDPPVALPTAVEEPTETAPEESTSDDTATGDHPTIFLPALTPDEAGEIRDNDHVKGNPDATVTIIEYSDFQ